MDLILGTAMWGWTVPRDRCFQLLDQFYRAGFRQIDGATNYPINKNPADFRLAEKILLEWIRTHGVTDLRLMMKVGSLNNMRTPDHNLTKSFLLLNHDDYRFRFGDNLDTLMIHWDNRDDPTQIRSTLEALAEVRRHGFRVGLSGIRRPDIYQAENEAFGLEFRIQIKHNLLHSDYHRYRVFHGSPRFITYGINAGGIKLDAGQYHEQSSLRVRGGDPKTAHPLTEPLREALREAREKKDRPEPRNFNHCGLCFAYHSPDIEGILIGPSRAKQLTDSLEFYRALATNDYSDLYLRLRDLHETYGKTL